MNWNSATALGALRGSDLLDLGMSANHIRHNLHPEHVVTYELCGRPTSFEQAIHEVVPNAGISVNLAQISDMEHVSLEVLKKHLLTQRDKLPGVRFHHLPVSRLQGLMGNILSFTEAIPGLQAAGLCSFRLEADSGFSSLSYEDLSELLHAAARCDLFASVSVTIGNSELLEQRIKTLTMVRDLQLETKAIQAVLVQVHHAATPEARREEEATAVDYLRMLAVTRIYLDNVRHIQTDWSVMGPKVLELALQFGADDAGAIPWSQSGSLEPSHHGGESELRRIIRDAGFRPVERDALFRQSLLH
jgi:cyclic dehypoxanthinyl futalosine synthase